MDDLKLERGYVITPENEPYRLDERMEVGSLKHFLKEVLPRMGETTRP